MQKIFSIVILSLFLISFFLWQGIYFPRNPNLIEAKLFLIEKGQNLFQIGENLEKENLIKNRFFFDFYVLIKGGQDKLQAGEYSLSPSMSIDEIAKKIISGDIAKIIVSIPEGFTVKQIEERLNLELPGENLEGFLFPDTYQFPLRVSGKEVVKRMQDNFEKKFTEELREEIEKQGKTIFEVVTMASLIEKEVKTKEDKALVSGILWKRLEIGMPLQVDAAPETYERQGLPEKPICNPGLVSILATVYPKSSSYWYYLSSPDGKTHFSETLEEHNIKKAKYLKLNNMLKSVIIIAFRDFRDEEYFVPKEVLESAGIEVKTASNQKGVALGADGGEAKADLLVSEINPANFDAIVFTGGPGCLENLDNENSYRVARETVSQNKILASICISPVILAKAGVLNGKKATVWSSPMDRGPVRILKENGAIYQDESVVVDGKIITGNGPGAAKEFGQALVEALMLR